MILRYSPRATAPLEGRNAGFSLPEAMMTMCVTMLVLTGLITTHLFGLRLFEFVRPKLAASDSARTAVTRLVGELRSANLIRIGQGGFNSFTEVGVGELQQANAIQVYATTNTTNFSRYYYDAADQKLKSVTNGSIAAQVISRSVSNALVFTAEDFAGNVLTNNRGNRVVGLTLQFSQIEYPIMRIGTGEFYDYYQMRTKVTQRKLAQP